MTTRLRPLLEELYGPESAEVWTAAIATRLQRFLAESTAGARKRVVPPELWAEAPAPSPRTIGAGCVSPNGR